MLQGKCFKALTIGAGLILFQQLLRFTCQITGQPSVLYYAAKNFQDAGFSATFEATRASIFLALLKLIMTGVAVVVDKLGRGPLLLGGVSGIVNTTSSVSFYMFDWTTEF